VLKKFLGFVLHAFLRLKIEARYGPCLVQQAAFKGELTVGSLQILQQTIAGTYGVCRK